MLLIMAPLAEPLRQALRTREKDGAKDGSTQLFTIFWGTVSAGGLGILRPRLYRWHGYRDSDPRKRFEMDPALCSGAATYTTDSGACGWDAVPEPVGCYGVPGWEYRNDRLGLAGLFLYADAGDSLDKDSFFHLVNLNIVGMVTFQWSPGLDWWLMVTSCCFTLFF